MSTSSSEIAAEARSSTRSKAEQQQKQGRVTEFYDCRATAGGATKLICRATGSGATKTTCHATKCKIQCLLVLDTQWRDRVGLSRQHHWRDRCQAGDDVALPVAPCGLARQGHYPGTSPASSPPPSLSFPHSSPTRGTSRRRRRPPHPPDPSKSGLLGGGKLGETFPTLPRRYCSHFFLL